MGTEETDACHWCQVLDYSIILSGLSERSSALESVTKSQSQLLERNETLCLLLSPL